MHSTHALLSDAGDHSWEVPDLALVVELSLRIERNAFHLEKPKLLSELRVEKLISRVMPTRALIATNEVISFNHSMTRHRWRKGIPTEYSSH